MVHSSFQSQYMKRTLFSVKGPFRLYFVVSWIWCACDARMTYLSAINWRPSWAPPGYNTVANKVKMKVKVIDETAVSVFPFHTVNPRSMMLKNINHANCSPSIWHIYIHFK